MGAPTILIVGTGPSGLTAALTLARNGIPVRIIEKTKTHRIGQRGAGLMPRSLETFGFLGVLEEIQNRYFEIPQYAMYKMPEGIQVVKEFYAMAPKNLTPSNPFLRGFLLGQDNLDKIIRAELERSGVHVELGVELVSLQQFDDRVDVKLLRHNLDDDTAEPITEEASYKIVVGADGAKGVVRKQIGISFLGETKEESFVVGDIQVDGLSRDRWHLWGDMADTLLSMRPTETPGLFNILVGGSKPFNHAEHLANEVSMKAFLKKGYGNREDIKLGEIVVMSHYRLNVRMAEKFQDKRVFLIGDAALSEKYNLSYQALRRLTAS